MSVSATELSGHLDSGEKTLWHGSPPEGLLLRRSDWFVVPFSLFWLAFVVFWLAGVTGTFSDSPRSPPVIFPIVGSVFVCVGLYMAIGRFFWDAYVRSQTLYALTNKRAIVLVRWPFRQVRSVELTAATRVETEESGDGSGSIFFGERMRMPAFAPSWFAANNGIDFMFERVAGVRNLVSMVRSVQTKH